MLCEMVKSLFITNRKPVAFTKVSWKYDRFKIKCKTQVIETKLLLIQHPRFTEFTFMKLFAANRETFGQNEWKVSWNGEPHVRHFHETFVSHVCTQYVQ
jgi:hypothetical protein